MDANAAGNQSPKNTLAEDTLQKAGALQRAIFNSANFSSIATDAKGVIQIFNVGAERMLGYSAAEVINKVTPAHISDPQEVIARARVLSLELGTPITPGFEALVFKAARGIEDIYELTYIRKDGSRFPAVVSVTALRDAKDAIIGYLLIGTDNTARMLAEEARRMSEARVAGIVNSAMDAVISIDEEQNIVLFNSAAERMFGCTAQVAMGESIDRFIPRRFQEKHRQYVEGFGKAGTTSRSMQSQNVLSGVRANSEEFPIEASISQVQFAGKKIFTVILRDITERKRAEEALRSSEADFRTLAEAMPQMVWTTRPDGWNIYFSQRWMDYTGLTLEQSLGHGWNKPFHPDDRQRAWDAWQQATTVTGVYSVECRLRRADGIYRWWLILGAPLRASDGSILKWFGTCTDITERKEAEEKIRLLNAELEQRVVQKTAQLQTANTELKASDENLFASEERYRSLVQSAREYAIFVLDIQGNITTWNAGAQRIKGYCAEEVIGKHFSVMYPQADIDSQRPQKELTIALEKGQYEEDGWRVRKGGTQYWANVLITVLRDQHGNHLGYSKIVRDLTDRKDAQEKLRESEEWLRSLVEGGNKYAIVTLDAGGNVTTWNAGAERIKGYRADEIIGKHLSLFYPAEDVNRGKPQRELKIAAETGQYEEDGWRVRKDGSLFWANVLLTVLRDSHGKHLGFSKVTRDLTDTVRAEEQARSFFTVSLELLCIAGFDGYFKLLNPVWEQTLGFTPDELCAKPFVEFIHPDDLTATHAAAKELSGGKVLNHFENRYRCKDGSYRWLAWSVAVSADRQLMYAAAADITERRRTENEIVSLNQALLRQNLELDLTNKELESFSYSISHDLRAPLRAIDGFSQALAEDCADKLDAEGQDSLGRIRGASQRMGNLIDDLLNLSRVSRSEMKREQVDLSKMARDILKELQESDPQRRVECLIADGLTANADQRLLHVVLTNLLANAWKFSAKCPDARIEFGSALEEGNTTFFVRDNGAGFDMAYAGKLFGAFQRLHAQEDFAGTGVGLATVQRIIHRHRGRVWAQSAVGSGATFHFTLNTKANVAAA